MITLEIDSCIMCPYRGVYSFGYICSKNGKPLEDIADIPDWCPLKPQVQQNEQEDLRDEIESCKRRIGNLQEQVSDLDDVSRMLGESADITHTEVCGDIDKLKNQNIDLEKRINVLERYELIVKQMGRDIQELGEEMKKLKKEKSEWYPKCFGENNYALSDCAPKNCPIWKECEIATWGKVVTKLKKV